MKHINIIYANNFLKDQYIISDPGIQTLNQYVSNKIKISPDEFYFEGFPIGPLYLKDIPDLSTILVKFHHPSDDLIFQFPNNEQIKIERASRMNYKSIVAHLNKLRFYFSDECIKKSLRFSVFGKSYDIDYAKGYFIEGIPIFVPIYIKLLVRPVIIQSNEMKFVFCENEKSNSVIKFLSNTFPQTTDFKICQAGPSYGELRLRATEKYEIRANYICTFHGPKGEQINLNLNFQSTFNDAKGMLVHSPQTNVFFFVKDKRIENLNLSIIPYKKDGNIFFDIESNPSYQMPVESNPPYMPQIPAAPIQLPKTPPAQYPTPPPAMPVPSAASPVTPPPSDLTKSQSKAKPVKVKVSQIEEKVEILFQFEKSIGKEIKPIKKQFKPTTTVNEMIEIIKNENDLDCEIEMSYKEEEDKVKIEPNETIKTIQQYIIQPNRQNIIYVGSPQKKPSTKVKFKKPKISINYDIGNSESEKPSKKAPPKKESKGKTKPKSNQSNKITYKYQTNESDEEQEVELGPEATVEEFKLTIKDQFGVDDIFNIKLIFAGKDLLNDIVLKNLNIGDTPLFVYIRSEQEIFLKTAKALQVIKIEEEEEISD